MDLLAQAPLLAVILVTIVLAQTIGVATWFGVRGAKSLHARARTKRQAPVRLAREAPPLDVAAG